MSSRAPWRIPGGASGGSTDTSSTSSVPDAITTDESCPEYSGGRRSTVGSETGREVGVFNIVPCCLTLSHLGVLYIYSCRRE